MSLKALLAASLFAALGVVSLFLYTRQLEVEASGGERVSILMISKSAAKDSILSDDQLSVREVPISYVDDRVVRASDKPKVVGVRVERNLEPQQLLSWTDVSVSGDDDRHLSQLVQPGTRALTLHIPQNYMSVELVRPGDYVDVLGIIGEGQKSPQSVVLMQKVLVLAVGHDTMPTRAPGSGPARNADQLLTIAVTLQESQTIALAAQKGPVLAVLRSPLDQSVSERTPAVTQLPQIRGDNVTSKMLVAAGKKPTSLSREE